MPAPEKPPHRVSSSTRRRIENRRRGRTARRRLRRRRGGLDLSEGGVKLYVMGRIAAAAVVGAALAASVAQAGDLQPAVPNVPPRLPDPYAVMLFENRSGVQGLNWMSAGAAFLVGEKAEASASIR